MRFGSLITLSSLIYSIIAIFSSYPSVDVDKIDFNILCGTDVYSAAELEQATYRGCQSLMKRMYCGKAGKCSAVKKFVGPKDYTGPEFKDHKNRVYIWGLPKRKGSDYVSDVLFVNDEHYSRCQGIAAKYRYIDVDKSFFCEKLERKPLVNLRNSDSPPRPRKENHSPPRERQESHSAPRPRKENHSPPRPRKESHPPAPDGQDSSNEVFH